MCDVGGFVCLCMYDIGMVLDGSRYIVRACVRRNSHVKYAYGYFVRLPVQEKTNDFSDQVTLSQHASNTPPSTAKHPAAPSLINIMAPSQSSAVPHRQASPASYPSGPRSLELQLQLPDPLALVLGARTDPLLEHLHLGRQERDHLGLGRDLLALGADELREAIQR